MEDTQKEVILDILNGEINGVNIVSGPNGKITIRGKEHAEHRAVLDSFAELLSVVGEWADEKIKKPEGEEPRARVIISLKTR